MAMLGKSFGSPYFSRVLFCRQLLAVGKPNPPAGVREISYEGAAYRSAAVLSPSNATCDQWLGVKSLRKCDWAILKRKWMRSVPPTSNIATLSGRQCERNQSIFVFPFSRLLSANPLLIDLALEESVYIFCSS